MKIKMATIGTIISLTCSTTACFAADFELITTNNLDSFSTLSIGKDTYCSDSQALQGNETCSNTPSTGETGQTPANGGSSDCHIPTLNLQLLCGSDCTVKVYDQTGCKGHYATGTLHVSTNKVTLDNLVSPSEFNATYSKLSDLSGNLTLTKNS
ncbi:MAG: hypothetical protein CMF55_01940 [Legionellales bacterium]|mgnify:CR=1 FL=1|nr:hypothetical protein [Legionellales bacterium]HAG62105.1 hypothetical protein [Coxiellaceae bacterium]